MEVDEAQTEASKFSKLSNGRLESSNTTSTTVIGGSSSNNILGMGEVGSGGGGGANRLREWPHSSRIIRVSRASGGKDRHSKVWTAKGPRDRRVRLSVATAIQFYDLQDRLGFDQPSKAVEWLIKAASDAISELPSLTTSFPETPRQQSDEKSALLGGNDEQGFDSSAELEMEMDRDPGYVQTQQQQQQQHGSNLSKSSACSSTSETSKGSGGLSFSRTEIRVKARERARERAKEKDTNQPEPTTQQQQQHVQSSSSFTQLLTCGIGNMNNPGVSSSPPMNYFSNTGLMGPSSSARGQIIQLGNSTMHQAMMAVSPFSVGGDQHQHQHHHQQQELQHFPFVPDHHLIVPAQSTAFGSSNDQYNLNFSISPSSIAAFNNNRGTLQSNSLPSLLPHFQRFSSSPLDGSTLPFFLGAAVDNQHHQQHQNHHHNAAQFPPGLQLCYGDNGGGLSDQKGKGKT